jgi:hypothetical protein
MTHPTEHAEQVALFQWARIMQNREPLLSMLVAIPNAGGYVGGFKSNMLRVQAMIKEGVAKGFPDIALFCHSYNNEFDVLFIELKRVHGSKPRPEQIQWHEALKKQGYKVCVCYGADEAIDVIKWYLDIRTP